MIHLRPQRVYKPSAASSLGNLDDFIDRYFNKDLYRLRLETPRGTSITADNSQITCFAHIFDKEDGTELTDLLKGRGYRPTWLLDGKPIDSTCVSEDGYQLTLETTHLPDIYQAVTLQARDTDILLALTDESQDKAWLQRVIASGDFHTHLLQSSEKLLNVTQLNTIRVEGLEDIKRDLSKDISANRSALEELHKNPLTVDKDGYWRVWDITQHQYVTTQYQSRGRDGADGKDGHTPLIRWNGTNLLIDDLQAVDLRGRDGVDGKDGHTPLIRWSGTNLLIDNLQAVDLQGAKGLDGKDAGRYLGKAVAISNDLWGNYSPAGSGYWVTAKEGDYVYLTEDSGSNWHKETYYIVREHTDKTVWEEYDIKGHTPVLTLDRDSRLLADGKLVSAESLKGKDGHTPVINWDGTKLIIDNMRPVDLRGEPGHNPSPEEVLDSSDFSELLAQEVDHSVTPKFISQQEIIASAFADQNQRIDAVEDTYKVTVTTRGEIRNAKVYDGVTVNNTPAIQHKAHIYSLFGTDKSTTLGDKLTWTINKGRAGSTTQPQERKITGLVCNVYDSDLVYNGVGARYYDIELESQFNPSSTTLEYKAHVTSQDTTGSKNLLQDGLSQKSLVNGCFQYSLYATTYDRKGTFTFSFDASRVKRPPKGGQFLIKFFPGSRYEKLEYIPFKFGERRYSVTTVIVEKTTGTGKSPDFIEVYPNSKEEYSKDPDSGDLVVDFVKLERGAVATEWTPAPEDILRDISNANEEISKRARTTHLDNALNYMYNLHAQLEETPFITVSKGGNLSVRGLAQYCPIKPGIDPDETVTARKCVNGVKEQSVDLVLRSDYNNLKAQVQNLAAKVAQLEARNVIKPDPSRGGQSTIYPKYGDWILTSDSREQYISFAGLNAEIGRSIYVQTRKRAYLYSIGHSYFGLPGSSTSENQWLSNNTTYRFVRASSDSWFVTASSSPYPWT